MGRCIHACSDIRDIGMYQSILRYRHMGGMTHNMNQPRKIATESLDIVRQALYCVATSM